MTEVRRLGIPLVRTQENRGEVGEAGGGWRAFLGKAREFAKKAAVAVLVVGGSALAYALANKETRGELLRVVNDLAARLEKSPQLATARNFVETHAKEVGEHVRNLHLGDKLNTVRDAVGGALTTARDAAGDKLTTVRDAVGGALTTARDAAGDKLNTLRDDVQEKAKKLTGATQAGVKAFREELAGSDDAKTEKA